MQRKNENKIRCHSKLDLESHRFLKRQQGEILNLVQDDNMLYNVKAFTLIELLVVVLIIGILAAVALPQYQKAVQKARMTEAISVLVAAGKAEQIYYLANGEYTNDVTALDMGPQSPAFSDNWTSMSLDSNGGRPHLETRAKFLPSDVYLIYQLDEEQLYCSQAWTAKTNKICQKFYSNENKIIDPSNASYEMYLISQ